MAIKDELFFHSNAHFHSGAHSLRPAGRRPCEADSEPQAQVTREGPDDLEAGGRVGGAGRRRPAGVSGIHRPAGIRMARSGTSTAPPRGKAGCVPRRAGAEEPPPPPRTPASTRQALPAPAEAAGGVGARRASGTASAPAEPSAAQRAARAGCARPRARAPPPEGRARAGPGLRLSRARRPPAAPRPGRRVPRSTWGGAAPLPPVQVSGAGTWVGRGARGQRTGGARGPGGGGADTSSARSWARCGVAEGSATLQMPLRPQGDANLAAASWAARGPGRGEPDALPKFPFADFAALDLTCEANPGR